MLDLTVDFDHAISDEFNSQILTTFGTFTNITNLIFKC